MSIGILNLDVTTGKRQTLDGEQRRCGQRLRHSAHFITFFHTAAAASRKFLTPMWSSDGVTLNVHFAKYPTKYDAASVTGQNQRNIGRDEAVYTRSLIILRYCVT